MSKRKIVVTGVAGRLGPYVVRHFLDVGYDVVGVDKLNPVGECEKLCKGMIFQGIDLMNFGECLKVLQGAYGVVHLAAVAQALSVTPDEITFSNNVTTVYNMLEAASQLGIRKAVIASSETIYGICRSKNNLSPTYVPMDEDHPLLPEDSYAVSKLCAEETAKAFHRRCGMQVVSLRLGNVITKELYKNFKGFIHNPKERRQILWSYIDARDIASACQLAIEKEGLGAPVLNIAADETSMDIGSRELLAKEFPDVKDIRGTLAGYETLLSNAKAKSVLGWAPVHKWRENV